MRVDLVVALVVTELFGCGVGRLHLPNYSLHVL